MKKTVYQFRNLDIETIEKLNDIKKVIRAKNLAQTLKIIVSKFHSENEIKKEIEKINKYLDAS